MVNSKHFVDVIKKAMDDLEFRNELMNDVEKTLKSKNLHPNLSANEIDELKNIFGTDTELTRFSDPVVPPACPYRGYS